MQCRNEPSYLIGRKQLSSVPNGCFDNSVLKSAADFRPGMHIYGIPPERWLGVLNAPRYRGTVRERWLCGALRDGQLARVLLHGASALRVVQMCKVILQVWDRHQIVPVEFLVGFVGYPGRDKQTVQDSVELENPAYACAKIDSVGVLYSSNLVLSDVSRHERSELKAPM